MTAYCKACGEPLKWYWHCFVCEHEAVIGRRLDRVPTLAVEAEQLCMFEVPQAEAEGERPVRAAPLYGDAA